MDWILVAILALNDGHSIKTIASDMTQTSYGECLLFKQETNKDLARHLFVKPRTPDELAVTKLRVQFVCLPFNELPMGWGKQQ